MVGVPVTMPNVRPPNRARKFKLWLIRSTMRLLVLLAIILNLVPSSAAQDTPTPVAGFRKSDQTSGFAGDLSTIYTELDQFWAGVFRVHGQAYGSPGLASTGDSVPTECAGGSDAFYCPVNATMYLDLRFVQAIFQEFGDFAPIVVLAHEWGHHLQALTNAPRRDSTFELQADCLAGVFAREAEQRNLLEPGDITEAVTISGKSGDNPLWPQDIPGAHGTNDERITSFMTGYITDLDGCNLPGFAGSATQPPVVVPEGPISTGPSQPVSDLVPYLPAALPLAHSGCFRIEDTVPLGFEDVVARLEGTEEARSLLSTWGWQASANRTYACDTPPAGDAGWIDLSLHVFGSPEAAQEAVDYFAALRAHGTRLVAADPPAMGDHAAVLTGPTTNGTEFTLYVSDGPLLVRVTGVSPDGIPFMNVLAVAGSVLASVPPTLLSPTPPPVAISTAVVGLPAPTQAPQPAPASTGIMRLLPGTLPEAACFMEAVPLVYTFPELVERFPGVPDAVEKLEALGWQEGVFNEYVCSTPAPGQLSRIDLSVHRFPDSAKASAAAVFFASSRALDTQLRPAEAAALGDSSIAIAGPSDVGEEYTLYVTAGPYLLRVTGVATDADPQSDVEHVMLRLLADVLLLVPTSIAAPTAVPTTNPIPTSTAVPTAPPSPTPLPTPTAIPQPTSTPLPTPTPPPTATATPFPTATPRPLLTATPSPMPSTLPTAEPTAAPLSCPPSQEPQESESEHVARVNQDLLEYGQRVASRNQAEPSAADFSNTFFESIYVLAEIGAFGCGNGGRDIYSGPSSPVEVLQLTYQVIDDFATVNDGMGTQKSPSWTVREVLQRLSATDMSPLSPHEQIAISNSVLLTVEPDMPRDSLRGFASQLDRAGHAYISALVHGETTEPYPAYLTDNGWPNIFD